MKVINQNNSDSKSKKFFLDTIENVSLLNNMNIASYSTIKSTDNFLIIVMPEYKLSLSKVNTIDMFVKANDYQIIIDICNALDSMHSFEIINGNLKPCNIIFNRFDESCNYFITDYCQQFLYLNALNKNPFTLDSIRYSSPELLKNRELSYKSDLWSVGCIIGYILLNKHIFDSKNLFDLFTQVISAKYDNDINIDNELRIINDKIYEEVIKKLLLINPNERLNFDEIRKFFFTTKKTDINDFLNSIVLDNNDNSIYIGINSTGEYQLTDPRIGDYGLEFICDNLNKMSNLQVFVLYNCDITTIGIRFLANSLKIIPDLKQLELQKNKIDNEGVNLLCKNLNYISKLEQLNLGDNPITEKGIEQLSYSLCKCPNLYLLFLSNIDINNKSKTKDRIKTFHPNVRLSVFF